MSEVLGYRWSVWFKRICVEQSNFVFEDEDDARSNATDYLYRYLKERKEAGCNDGEIEDMFDIEITEVLGEEEFEDVGLDYFP